MLACPRLWLTPCLRVQRMMICGRRLWVTSVDTMADDTPVKFDNVLYRYLSSLSASRGRWLGIPTAQGQGLGLELSGVLLESLYLLFI